MRISEILFRCRQTELLPWWVRLLTAKLGLQTYMLNHPEVGWIPLRPKSSIRHHRQVCKHLVGDVAILNEDAVFVGAPDPGAFLIGKPSPPTITSPDNYTFSKRDGPVFTITTTGFPAPTFSLAGGSIDGLTVNPTTGVLSGKPTAAGAFTDTLIAANTVGSTDQNFTLTVIGFSVTSSLNPASRGQMYGEQLAAAGGLTPYKWKKLAPLPKGLKLSSTGLLSGIPSTKLQPGNYSISIQVRDSTKRTHEITTATLTLALS